MYATAKFPRPRRRLGFSRRTTISRITAMTDFDPPNLKDADDIDQEYIPTQIVTLSKLLTQMDSETSLGA
jgi:hypothetical protein